MCAVVDSKKKKKICQIIGGVWAHLKTIRLTLRGNSCGANEDAFYLDAVHSVTASNVERIRTVNGKLRARKATRPTRRNEICRLAYVCRVRLSADFHLPVPT